MKIFFVRHGHPDYTEPKALGYPGFGNDLAPLDALGRSQAEQTARDPRLKQGQLIVASPFTRALQTAAGSHVFVYRRGNGRAGPGGI